MSKPEVRDWSRTELQRLEDAIEYHGRLDDRVIDDLAETFGRTPQAVKSKARQLRVKMRSAVPEAVPSIMGLDIAVEKAVEPATATGRSSRSGKISLKVPPYTELINNLDQLLQLADDLHESEKRLESARLTLTEAKQRLYEARIDALRRFPGIDVILTRLLGVSEVDETPD